MCLICIQYDNEINFYYNKIWEYIRENDIHFEWLDQSIINPAVGFHASHWQKRMGDAQEIRTPIEGPRLPFYSSFYHSRNYSFDSCWYFNSLLLFCCFLVKYKEYPIFLCFCTFLILESPPLSGLCCSWRCHGPWSSEEVEICWKSQSLCGPL